MQLTSSAVMLPKPEAARVPLEHCGDQGSGPWAPRALLKCKTLLGSTHAAQMQGCAKAQDLPEMVICWTPGTNLFVFGRNVVVRSALGRNSVVRS